MKAENIIKLFSFALVLMILSCRNDEVESPEPQVPTQITTVTSTAFTATVSGTIDGVTYDDLNKGMCGILYTDDSDGAQGYFDSWLKGNNNPGCSQVGRIKFNTECGLEANLSKLKPETAYSYCLYYQSKDGKTRLLSTPGSFTTRAFSCTMETSEAQTVGFYKAVVQGRAGADARDLALCTTGIVFSRDADEPTLEDGLKEANSISDDGSFEVDLKKLLCGTEYRYRTYLRVDHTDMLLYGPVRTLTTRYQDEMAVDLGLSVKWASCNLGAEEPQEAGEYYRWGETEPSTTVNGYSRPRGMGSNICATEYDAAHVVLSGHWRMPTMEEIDELIESCEVRFHTMGDGYVAEFIRNGNSICIPAAGFYNIYGLDWVYYKDKKGQCSIVIQSGDESNNRGLRKCWRADVNLQYNNIEKNTIEFPNEFAIPIRPVWDPNLRD